MKNLGNMMKQAQEMQAKLASMQSRMEEQEVTGSAGGGMVSVTLNGKGQAKKCAIDAKLMTADDKDMLEDLIVAAINDARTRIDTMMADETQKMMGGMALPPGFKLPF